MIPIERGEWYGSFATKAAAKRYLTLVWTGPKVADRARWQGAILNVGDRWQIRVDAVDYPICASSDSTLRVCDCWCAECAEYRRAAKKNEVGLATYLNAVTDY